MDYRKGRYLYKPTTTYSKGKKGIYISLAIFKPKKIKDFIYKEDEREWDKEKLEYIKAHALQQDLFKSTQNIFEVVKKIPYKFSYIIEDKNGKSSTMMIEDWEIGQLFWNCLKRKEKEMKSLLVKMLRRNILMIL